MKATQRHFVDYCKALLFLVTIGVLVQPGFAQEDKRFESVLVRDGLVQSTVLEIISDEYGYLWFGTHGGLSRFDGSEFVNYSYDPADSVSLSNNTVLSLKSLNNGSLWIGTANGLNRYDWFQEHFIRYTHPVIKNRNIETIEQWSTDTLLIKAGQQVVFFDIKGETFFKMPQFDLFDGQISKLQLTKSGRTLLYAKGAIHLIGKDENSQLQVDGLRAMYSDSNNNIWALTFKDLRLISPDLSQTKIIDVYNLAGGRSTIKEDAKGNIHVLTTQLKVYDLNGDYIENHQSDPNKEFSLLDVNLSSLFFGKDGIWWIGTGGYGVNKYDPNKPSIGLLGRKRGYSPSLSNGYVTTLISKDDENIFIGTAQSLDVFDKEQVTVERIYPHRVDYLSYAEGRYWASTSGSLLKLDMEKKEVEEAISVDRLGTARAIKGSDNGVLWIACGTGMIKFDIKTENSEVFLPPSEHSWGRNTGDWFTSILKTGDELLLGTTAGLYSMQLATESILQVTNPELEPLQRSYIKCVEMDQHGIIWIGTSGDGLFRWNRLENSLKQLTMADGLPSNVIYGVLEDENGFLWMSTNGGLSRLDDRTGEFLNLDIGYGLQSNEFNTSAYFKSAKGVFYFGGVEGINYFNPGATENSKSPETHITGFYLRNQRMSPSELGINSGAIMDADTIILSYEENMLAFDFKCSNFTIPQFNQYAYYMENLEEDWNYVGSRRFANYSSLPPGEYILKVKSANNNGQWDPTPAQLVIIINAPYWQKAWFKALLIILTLIVILSITGLRIRSLKRNELKLQQLVDERTKKIETTNQELRKTIHEKEITQQKLIQSEKMAALGTLSAGVGHEINNPLNIISQALVSMTNELNQNGTKEPKKLTTYMSFIQNAIDRATQIVMSLSHFSRSGISFDESCRVESIIDDCIVLLNSKIKHKAQVIKNYASNNAIVKGNSGKLHQVFFNLLSNAEQSISGQGIITITTHIHKENLEVLIADTGAGISPEDMSKIFDPFFTTKEQGKGTGLGLSITHTILEEHGGTIKVESLANKGTAFTVTLPITS